MAAASRHSSTQQKNSPVPAKILAGCSPVLCRLKHIDSPTVPYKCSCSSHVRLPLFCSRRWSSFLAIAGGHVQLPRFAAPVVIVRSSQSSGCIVVARSARQAITIRTPRRPRLSSPLVGRSTGAPWLARQLGRREGVRGWACLGRGRREQGGRR